MKQNKTRHALSIRLEIDSAPTELGTCVELLLARPVQSLSGELICTPTETGPSMKMLRSRFDTARAPATEQAVKKRGGNLAKRIKALQFPDIARKQRAKLQAWRT